MQKTKKDSDDLNASAQTGANELASGMKTEIAKASSDGTAEIVDCQKTSLNSQRMQALNDIDKNISVVQAALQQANSVGATELGKSMQASLEKLVAARKELNDQFDGALKQLTSNVPTNH
jgi:hypothetical protein